jgi:hypothetical protein
MGENDALVEFDVGARDSINRACTTSSDVTPHMTSEILLSINSETAEVRSEGTCERIAKAKNGCVGVVEVMDRFDGSGWMREKRCLNLS